MILADLQDNSTEGTTLTETEIVAQAITELHQVCAPGTTAGDNTTLVSKLNDCSDLAAKPSW